MKSFLQFIAEDMYNQTADCPVCRGSREYPAGQECRECEGSGRMYVDDTDWTLDASPVTPSANGAIDTAAA